MGEIMKKLALGMTLLASATLMTSCGGNNTNDSTSSKTKTEQTKKVATSTNKKIASELSKEINKDGKVATVKVEPEVVDDQSKKDKDGNMIAHQDIIAKITDKDVIDKLKDDEQSDDQLFTEGIKEIADKFHSELKGNDTISIDYDIDTDQANTVALVNKNGRIVK
jgi:ABC-type glycerol-3-phosphate transport system substrate-binding protein